MIECDVIWHRLKNSEKQRGATAQMLLLSRNREKRSTSSTGWRMLQMKVI